MLVYSKLNEEGHRRMYWCGDPLDADLVAEVTVESSTRTVVKERKIDGRVRRSSEKLRRD